MQAYKIALVCDWYLPRIGGVELQLRDLARELSHRGHSVRIVTATPGLPRVDGIPVERLAVDLLPGWHTIGSRRALAPLERVLDEAQFDIVHAHSVYSPLAHAACWLANKLRIPSVLTNHSLLRHAAIPVLRALDYRLMWSSWPDVMTAVSSTAAEDTRRASFAGEVLVVPNGIDASEWAAHTSAPELPRVTCVMRLTRRKRPGDLVRAIPRVNALLPPSLRPRFTIIGDGPLRGEVEREAEHLGVRAQVEFLGFRSRREIRDILAHSTLFALPTVKEAFGISVLEARCAGVPVVAMGHSGVSDLIDHGREGMLCDSRDEFATRIVEIIRDRALRTRLADNARRRLDRFSWERVIERHLEIYRLAIARRRGLGDPAGSLLTLPLASVAQ